MSFAQVPLRRFAFRVFLAALFACPSFANRVANKLAGGGGPATYTLVYNATDATAFTQSVGDSSGTYYWGFYNFNDSVSRTFTKIEWKLSLGAGSIAGKTFTCRIWTMSGTSLATEIATSTGVTGSDAWSTTLVPFIFSAPVALSASTNYTITIDMGGVDAGNYANIHWNSTGAFVSAAPADRGWFNSSGTIQGNNGGYSPQGKFYVSP